MISRAKIFIHSFLPKNAFARHVGVLLGGAAGAQILLIISAPILTRLYSPEDFGVLAVFMSLLALIGAISSLRYELAIPVPKDEVEAANVAALGLILVAISTFLTSIFTFMFGQSLSNRLGVTELANHLWLLPAGVFLSGVYTIFNYWSLRSRSFSAIAVTRLRQALVTIVIQLAAFKFGVVALLCGQVAGQGIGITTLGRHAMTGLAFRSISRKAIFRSLKRYKRFPYFNVCAGLINIAGNQLPLLIIASFYSAGVAGLYALSHRVLSLPLGIIAKSVQSVFYAETPGFNREKRLTELVERIFSRLTEIALPPFLILAICSSEIFSKIFGMDWAVSGQLASIMAPWLLIQFCTGPLATIFAAIEKQHIGLLLQAQLFIIRFTAILIGVSSGSFIDAILLFSFGSFTGYLIFLSVIFLYTGVNLIRVLKLTLIRLIMSLIVTFPVVACELLPDQFPIRVEWALILSVLFMIPYYGRVVRSKWI